MNKWIKLLRAIPGTKWTVGEIVEVDAEVARAYVDAKFAEEATGPAAAALDAATQAELDKLRNGFTDTLKLVGDQVRNANEKLRPLVQIANGESEDDKLVKTGGFKTMGHFAFANVRGPKHDNPDPDHLGQLRKYEDCYNRISRAATGMNEASEPDGALAIPPQFATTIWERTRKYENLSERVDMMPISGNAWQMPADAETSRADGSRRGGIQGYWDGEAAQYTKSKPTFSDRYLRLKKLTVLVYATNEVLEDAPGLEAYINKVAPEEITFKVNDALVNGTGSGMPLGLLNSPGRVTVTQESSQASATLQAVNVIKMWARLYAPSRANAVYLINQDVETQLQQMTLATGTYSGQLVYMPPTGLSGSNYATLNGRPIIPIEQCATVGTEGDIILADLSSILAIRKQAGLQQAMSIHLRFDYDETVFKFSLRMDAQHVWQKPLTPFKGSNTQSSIVTLHTRNGS
jgi:HK97 family phage major capsid protein